MKADILGPKALFQKGVRYVVPTFQRPYVWNQDDQWEPLWNDVRNTAERYLDELDRLGNSREADAERATPAHFLGAVVLQQQPTAAKDIEQRHLIDGQQRLTTLQLLLDSAREVFESLQLPQQARRLSKLVLNDRELIVDDDHVFKIWPTNVDREAFRQTMRNGDAVAEFPDSKIAQAHEFFELQIREWLAGNQDLQRQAAALETALTGLLQMVVIDLETNDDSHMIFETLNARGTPLIASDLIKNFVLYQARELRRNEETFYQTYWSDLENEWWREEVRQGRLVRPRIDMFLNYWLSMRTTIDVEASKVFEEFQKYARQRDIEEVAKDISSIGGTYRNIEHTTDPDVALFVYRWQVMDAGVVTPVLLLLFSASPSQLSQPRRIRALKAIESFLVRRMVSRMTTKDYNRLFLDLAELLQRRGLQAADDVVIEFLSGQTADSREWPNDQRLRESILGLPLYRLLTRGRLRLFLEGIEQTMRTAKAEDRNVQRNLTIEHVMPRRWHEHWPLPEGQEPESAAADRDRMIHTIGNLTLVTDALNPSLSNGPWPKKRQGLRDHSVLYLNKDILSVPSEAQWDEASIRKRGERLAGLAAQAWPGPSPLTS
jgi:hypothetical protein